MHQACIQASIHRVSVHVCICVCVVVVCVRVLVCAGVRATGSGGQVRLKDWRRFASIHHIQTLGVLRAAESSPVSSKLEMSLHRTFVSFMRRRSQVVSFMASGSTGRGPGVTVSS